MDLLRGQHRVRCPRSGATRRTLLLKAAQRLERLDDKLARDTYLDAWGAALSRRASEHRRRPAGCLPGGAVRPPVRSGAPGPPDLLLDSLATLITDGRAAAAPLLAGGDEDVRRRAVPDRSEPPLGLADAWCRPMRSGMRRALYAICAGQLQRRA